MNCLCNLFDDNGTLWIIVIALIILFCCCGEKGGCGDCGYPSHSGCGC